MSALHFGKSKISRADGLSRINFLHMLLGNESKRLAVVHSLVSKKGARSILKLCTSTLITSLLLDIPSRSTNASSGNSCLHELHVGASRSPRKSIVFWQPGLVAL